MAATLTDVFLIAQHLLQAVFCLRCASISYVTIVHLRKYEPQGRKLAEWYDAYDYKLRKVRSTQIAAVLAILASFVTTMVLATLASLIPRWVKFALSPIMLIWVSLARRHIKSYWVSGKNKTAGTRIPFPRMGSYNEAQRQIQKLLKVLEYLAYTWVVASLTNAMLR